MANKPILCSYHANYFSRDEFECKCGCGLGLNDMDFMSGELILALDIIRNKVGAPIRVNSGWRCVEHNERVRGVANSRHLYGHAADISTGNYNTLLRVAEEVVPLFGLRIVRYDDRKFLHIQTTA